VLLHALADLSSELAAPVGDTIRRRQLAEWATNRPDDLHLEPDLLALGLLALTRTDGMISIEIEGIFAQMSVDPSSS
jgi:hypothetical protein